MKSKSSFFKKIYKVHVYIGLFVAVHFLILSLTGLILLFEKEISGNDDEISKKSFLSNEETAANYGVIEKKLLENKLLGSGKLLALFPDDENLNVINARVGQEGSVKLRGSLRSQFNLTTSEQIIKNEKPSKGFFGWVLELHREFLMGSNGKLYVGFIGLLYAMMLISGIFIYGKFMRGRALGDIRKARIPRLVDLHKYVGILTFGWSLLVGFTGVFLAFNGVLIKLFQKQALGHLSQQFAGHVTEEMAPLETLVKEALTQRPGSFISYISYPDTEFGIPGHHLFLMNGTTPLTERLSELLVLNSQTGALAEVVKLPLYLKVVLLSEPLHFGDYGGIFLKIIWALFTLGSLFVVGVGIFSFWQKRRNRGAITVQTATSAKNLGSSYGLSMGSSGALVLGLVLALFTKGWVNFLILLISLIPLIWILSKKRRAHG